MLRHRTLAALLLISIALAAIADARPTQTAKLKVFLVAGQSNAEGADTNASEVNALPPYVGAAVPQTDVRFWYETGPAPATSGGWIVLQPEFGSQRFGPELSFATRVKAAQPDRIAIIKSARGGSNLAVDWEPGNTSGFQMYARTLALVQTALADLTADGIDWQLEGVIWQQGENDMLDNAFVAQYAANLTALIARLRSDLGVPDLPWHIGAVSDKCVWGMDFRDNMQVMRQQQLAVAAADPNVHFVPTSHLSFKMIVPAMAPHFHFGTEGMLQLGEAHADSYLQTLGVNTTHASQPFETGFPADPGQTVRVFIAAGQRSMEGERAYTSEIAGFPTYAGLDAPQQNVAYRYRLAGGLHTSTDWAPLGPADYFGNFGPELSLGQTLDSGLDDPVAVIKVTHSAALLEDWLPAPVDASLPQYAKSITFIQNALADLESQGLDPVLEAVVWLPSEHSAWWPFTPTPYGQGLASVIAQMRIDLAAPNLRWLILELPDASIWETSKLDAQDAKIQAVVDADPNAWFIDTDAITTPPDSPTFATAGTLQAGRLAAEFYLSLAKARPYGTPKPGTQGAPRLAVTPLPVLGTTITLALSNGNPGDAPTVWAGFEPASLPFDGGTQLMIPSLPFPAGLFDSNGLASTTVDLPGNPALAGLPVYLQGVFIDTGPGATGIFQTAQTAGLELVLGL